MFAMVDDALIAPCVSARNSKNGVQKCAPFVLSQILIPLLFKNARSPSAVPFVKGRVTFPVKIKEKSISFEMDVLQMWPLQIIN